MKKLTVAGVMACMLIAAAHAYNPPVNGENYLELSSPKTLTGAASVAGGALFYANPDSIIFNPALTAEEQRVILNFAGTVMFSENEANPIGAGSAFQAGILIPSKLYNFSGYLNGTFAPFLEMNVGNYITSKASLSKQITEKLDIGLGATLGMAGLGLGYGFDWILAADVGYLYKIGNLGFMKDFRYGVSVMNLGKTFSPSAISNTKVRDSEVTAGEDVFGFPSLATIKVGAAASLFKNDIMNLGASLDFTTPCFQNLIVDMGLQYSLKNMLVFSVSEKLNIVELVNGHNNAIPSVSLSFKFSFDVKNNEYLAKNDWSESEINAYAGYKKMYETVNAVSIGADLILGMQDTTAPVIDIWFDEDEE